MVSNRYNLQIIKLIKFFSQKTNSADLLDILRDVMGVSIRPSQRTLRATQPPTDYCSLITTLFLSSPNNHYNHLDILSIDYLQSRAIFQQFYPESIYHVK